MTLMDYRGFRLIATTRLPLSKNSLVYGSADGGATIRKDDPVLNTLMITAAKRIGIKEHVVGVRQQKEILAAPTDIEGHIGTDGRRYVLDTARVCPPEPPLKSFVAVVFPADDDGSIVTQRTMRFWRLKSKAPGHWTALRSPFDLELTADKWNHQIDTFLKVDTLPGLVTSETFMEGDLYHLVPENPPADPYGANVNSRASTLVGKIIYGPAVLLLRGRKGTQLFNLLRYPLIKKSKVPLSSDAFTAFGKTDSNIHNPEVEEVFYQLIGRGIAQFVESLETSLSIPSRRDLIAQLQGAGINIRLLGLVRSNLPEHMIDYRAMLLAEMVSRATKNYLRARLRTASKSSKDTVENIIVTHFNILLGESSASSFFWRSFVKMQLASKFGKYSVALTPEEMSTRYDLRRQLTKSVLLQSLAEQVGVEFKHDVLERFQRRPDLFEVRCPLSASDISCLTVRVRHSLAPEHDVETLQLAFSTFDFENVARDKLPEFLESEMPESKAHAAAAFLNRAESTLLSAHPDLDLVVADVNHALGLYNDLPELTPLEITVKAFYLRGCVYLETEKYDDADSHLRAAYFGLVMMCSAQSKAHQLQLETDAPIALLVLDKLILLCVILERKAEAYALAKKCALLWYRLRYPGSLSQIQEFMGHRLPYFIAAAALSKFRGEDFPGKVRVGEKEHFWSEILSPLKMEETLRNQPASNNALVSEWIDTVRASDARRFGMLSLSPTILETFIEQRLHLEQIHASPLYHGPLYGSLNTYSLRERTACCVATPAVIRAGGQNELHVSLFFPDLHQYDFKTLEVYLLPAVENGTLKPTMIMAGPVLLERPKVANYFIFPLPDDLPVGTYCLGLTADSYRVVSNQIEIVSADVKKGIISMDTITSTLKYHAEFDDLNIAAVTGQPHTSSYVMETFDEVFIAHQDGSVVTASGCMIFGRIPVQATTEEDYRSPYQSALSRWKTFQPLSAFKTTQIASGYDHTLVLTDTGDVFSFGQNDEGQLGQGDMVARAAPRMINRLRGKGIIRLFAGRHRSYAIDVEGRLYHWGYRAASIPELHPYFAAKHGESEHIRVVQVAMCPVPETSSTRFFTKFAVVAVLSDTGVVYLIGGTGKTEEQPEPFSAAENVFGVQIALNQRSFAILDKDGQVWTAGYNDEFDLGSGGALDLKRTVHVSHHSWRNEMPSVVNQVQFNRRNTKISSICATSNQYFALSTDGAVFHWGAGTCIPIALLDLRHTSVSQIYATSYTAFFQMGPAPIMLELDKSDDLREREQRRTAEDAQRLSYTVDGLLIKPTDSPTAFTVDWRRNELRKARNDRIVFVSPGANKSELPALFRSTIDLPERENYGTLLFSTSGETWGPIPLSPAVPPGLYELLYMANDENNEELIMCRSVPFEVVRDLSRISIQYPTRVLPAQKFTISWTPAPELLYASICCMKMPENQLFAMHMISPDGATSVEQELHMESEYQVIVGRGWDHDTKKFVDMMDFNLPPLRVSAPRLHFEDMRFEMGPGPYRVRQAIPVKWDIKPEARSLWKGTEYFGFYTLNDPNPYPLPMGGIVMMRFADHADKIFPPEKPGVWNLRFQVVTTGVVVIHEMPIEVLPEKEPEPQPPVFTAIQAPALAGGLPTIVVPSYSSWNDFFKACEIPDMFCNIYCTVMSAQNVDPKLIPSLEPPIIEKMGIATPAHQLMIMNKVREIRAAEMKQFIAQYLSGLASTGAIQQPLAQIISDLQKN